MSIITKTIRISKETYKELSKQGDLSETFDSVIKKLIQQNQKEMSLNK